jgi:hypothetical protein
MQAWWAAGSVMLTQGSPACACAGGMQRGARATAAAADTPNIALFISDCTLNTAAVGWAGRETRADSPLYLFQS